MKLFLSIALFVLALIFAAPQMVSAQYAAIAVQSGSPNADTNSTDVLGKLRYEFDEDVSAFDRELSFEVEGLLTFGDNVESLRRTNGIQKANMSYYGDRVAMKFGRELILWGVADGFNPTDVVTPFNYQMASYGSKDQRIGVDGALLDFTVSDSLTFSALAILNKPTNLNPRGVDPTGTYETDKPFRTKTQSYGARLNWQSAFGDFNFSVFDGAANQAVVIPSGAGTALAAPNITMIGLDFDTVVGPWRIFSETALHSYGAGETSIASAFLPDDELQASVGVERELTGSNRLSFQLFHRDLRSNNPTATGMAAPLSTGARQSYGQFSDTQNGASLSFFWESPSTRLSADLTVASWFEDDSYIRARAKYRLDENQALYLFGDWFTGPNNSPFGSLSDTSSMSLEYRRFF